MLVHMFFFWQKIAERMVGNALGMCPCSLFVAVVVVVGFAGKHICCLHPRFVSMTTISPKHITTNRHMTGVAVCDCLPESERAAC